MTAEMTNICGTCKHAVAHYHIMWSNQHGCCYRWFCRHCGTMTDYTTLNNSNERKVEIMPMRADIRPLWWQPGYKKPTF